MIMEMKDDLRIFLNSSAPAMVASFCAIVALLAAIMVYISLNGDLGAAVYAAITAFLVVFAAAAIVVLAAYGANKLCRFLANKI